MSRSRLTLIASTIILTFAIYSLPRVLKKSGEPVSSKEEQPTENVANADRHEGHDHSDHEGHDHSHDHAHNMEGAEELHAVIVSLKEKWENSEMLEKKHIFADSLAGVYKRLNQFDSAAFFAELSLPDEPSALKLKSVGEYCYEAFQFAPSRAAAADWGEKTRNYLAAYLKENPGDLTSKTHLAMTYVSTDQPMTAIMELREVLAQDPDQADALFAMGMLSVQSGQYDKASERFKHLTEVDPQHLQAHFYLGLSYFELGKKSKAKSAFEWVVANSNDPVVQATAGDYLEQLQ
ncbi:tetratricopeptide repeat protein [Persicobacter diffluens]|uniref:Tetratricopeptide repeat protein n=1 Tax=Persicobacter diffluens TaxID=981 RepID=A0AAN4VUL2_9BACT|nr:hypothetical protein PEDI_01510 [Persicobacter diffluens]